VQAVVMSHQLCQSEVIWIEREERF